LSVATARPDPLPVEPLRGRLDADVSVPGSKSATNRALVVAALAGGSSRLRGALLSDDTEAMIDSLRRAGWDVEVGDDATTIDVHGRTRTPAPGETCTLEARASGTTARFLAPLCALDGHRYRIDGAAQLRARPMGPGLESLESLGATVTRLGERPDRLPVEVEGPLRGGTAALAGDVSSQFVSGLMMVGPLVPGGLRIELTTAPVSEPYLDLTIAVMADFGGSVHRVDARTYEVPAGRYVGRDVLVEPDASAASYFFAAAAICGGRVRVEGLGRNTVQGDLAFVDVLERMGCEVDVGTDATEVRGTGELRGVDVDLGPLSDTAPTLAAVAAFASGPVRATGIGFIRAKETDRIAAAVAELRRLGVDAVEEDDGFLVRPGGTVHGATVRTYDDHRMAMSFALVGLRVAGVSIADPGCVAKTFPGYWDALDALRTRVQ
jgi:3-phosphoshikimate 1-carboxyvinyltransferase